MSDRMPAEIWIGGKLPRSLLSEFPIDDLRLDWDENPLVANTEEGIMASRDDDGLLHFADAELTWGEFQDLEEWLREHNLPFRRFTSAKYEYDAAWVEFRPDLQDKRRRDTCSIANASGNPVIETAAIEKIAKGMAKLVKLQATTKTQCFQSLKAWERHYRRLVRLVPPVNPPLPPFHIVDV